MYKVVRSFQFFFVLLRNDIYVYVATIATLGTFSSFLFYCSYGGMVGLNYFCVVFLSVLFCFIESLGGTPRMLHQNDRLSVLFCFIDEEEIEDYLRIYMIFQFFFVLLILPYLPRSRNWPLRNSFSSFLFYCYQNPDNRQGRKRKNQLSVLFCFID